MEWYPLAFLGPELVGDPTSPPPWRVHLDDDELPSDMASNTTVLPLLASLVSNVAAPLAFGARERIAPDASRTVCHCKGHACYHRVEGPPCSCGASRIPKRRWPASP